VEGIGQMVFYVAASVGAVAGLVTLAGVTQMGIAAVRNRGVRRPMWINYARLVFAFALPTMIIGLVLWGRLAWWFLLLFAPFFLTSLVIFRMGTSISRRRQTTNE
jgi:hypothetical protein